MEPWTTAGGHVACCKAIFRSVCRLFCIQIVTDFSSLLEDTSTSGSRNKYVNDALGTYNPESRASFSRCSRVGCEVQWNSCSNIISCSLVNRLRVRRTTLCLLEVSDAESLMEDVRDGSDEGIIRVASGERMSAEICCSDRYTMYLCAGSN